MLSFKRGFIILLKSQKPRKAKYDENTHDQAE